MEVKAKTIELTFDHVGSGLQAKGSPLKGFTVSDEKGKFFPAGAKTEGNRVIVSSTNVSKPVAVRYNWAMMPDGNLFNAEGLPAAPFRSDMPKSTPSKK